MSSVRNTRIIQDILDRVAEDPRVIEATEEKLGRSRMGEDDGPYYKALEQTCAGFLIKAAAVVIEV